MVEVVYLAEPGTAECALQVDVVLLQSLLSTASDQIWLYPTEFGTRCKACIPGYYHLVMMLPPAAGGVLLARGAR